MSLTSYRAAPPRAKKRKTRTKSSGRPACKVSDPPLAAMLHEAGRPGDDLLSRALRQSTIGATSFHDRVRNGIGWDTCAITTWSSRHIYASTSLMLQCTQGNIHAAEAENKEDIQNSSVRLQIAARWRLPLRTADQAYRTISTN